MENLYAFTRNYPSCPVYAPGERYAFYANFDQPISDPAFANFRLDIYKGNTPVLTNIGTLQQDMVTGFTYNIYSIFDFPELTNGYYQFVIFDAVANVIKATSNFILVENDPAFYNNAPMVMYRNESNIYGFNYELLTDFFNIFRLSLIKIDAQYDLQKTQYRNTSDKRLRNIKSYRFKYRKIESYYFTEDDHDAASVMYEHDGIYIDGVKYETKDAYQVTVDPINDETKGSVNAYVDQPNIIYKFPITTLPAINNQGVIVVEFGDTHLSVVGGQQVYTAQVLIGKTNYRIKSTQLGGEDLLRTEDVSYDAPSGSFTILIDGFLLTPGDQLIIFPYILNPDSLP